MTTQEFSDAWSTIIGSTEFPFGYAKGAVDFTEYDKSLYLTQAQENLIRDYIFGRNDANIAFESSEESKRYLNNLVVDAKLKPFEQVYKQGVSGIHKYNLPDDCLYVVYEEVIPTDNRLNPMLVYPTKHDDLIKIVENPFRKPSIDRCLRVDSEYGVDIYCNQVLKEYNIRYIRKPKPIILEELEDGLTIDGYSNVMECELHEMLHMPLLRIAIQLGLQDRGVGIGQQQRNTKQETE